MTDPVMYLLVNKSLGMSPNKTSAQIGHAVEMISKFWFRLCIEENDNFANYTDEELLVVQAQIQLYEEYERTGTTKIVLPVRDLAVWNELKSLPGAFVVVDEGRTEIPPNSETVIGFFPMRKSERPEAIKGLNAQ